jgi:zinc transport system substrate-binding protein
MNVVIVGLMALLVTTILITASSILTKPMQVDAANSPFSNARSTNLASPSNSQSIIKNNNTTIPQGSSTQAKIKVVASFFPIYEFVKAVGRDKIDASVLIPVGTEPHDFDPTIQQIQNVQSADILVYNGAGMEASWINKTNPKFSVDSSKGMKLLAGNDPAIHAPTDPHIWLDPILAIHQIENIRDGLIKVDPTNTAYYNQNAQKFIGQLKSLDTSIRSQLSNSNCAKRDFLTFHQAFGYFAKEYGLNQHSIHQGLTPEGEILPQRLGEIIKLADDLGINIIYSEDLIDPRSAQTIAQEIPNGKVMVLSPIEGIKPEEQKAGIGYLNKMNQDIDALKVGLQCRTWH